MGDEMDHHYHWGYEYACTFFFLLSLSLSNAGLDVIANGVVCKIGIITITITSHHHHELCIMHTYGNLGLRV